MNIEHAEIVMPRGSSKPHVPHVWQMSATGYCECRGVPGMPGAKAPEDADSAVGKWVF